MDPQPPPPTAPSPAAFARHHHHHHHAQRRPDSTVTHGHESACAEKDAYQRQLESHLHRGSKGSNARGHDSVISHPFSPRASSPPSPSSSVSSAGRKHGSIDEIRRSSPANVQYPPRVHIDPEKAHVSSHSPPSQTRVSASSPDVAAVVYDSGEYHEKGPEEKPVQLLLFLSCPCAFLSFAITLWTTLCLFFALLLQPLRLCSSRPSLSTQITAFLAPPLNWQLHLVYSHAASTDYSPSMLVVVHLFSPIIAVGVAIAAWTAAFFWFFSAILGDPAGQDGHNDGKESILGVRNWWERWLSRALR